MSLLDPILDPLQDLAVIPLTDDVDTDSESDSSDDDETTADSTTELNNKTFIKIKVPNETKNKVEMVVEM